MRPLVFRPNDQEAIFLEDNNINWSEWCHKHLARDISNKKFEIADRFQMPFLMIMLGILILFIGISNIFIPLILVMCYILSLFSISFGIFSLVGGLKHGRL